MRFTAIIEKESDWFVALCPELDVASQGRTLDEAKSNLKEALEALIEELSPSELEARLSGEVYVTSVEVRAG